MGRRKIEIQPLPDSQIRAKFKKRKVGLIKKASELATLCGAQVALIIFSKDGEEVIDMGYNATTVEIIRRYWSHIHNRNQSGLPQQRIPASQVPQFQPNSDSSSPMDPRAQQEVAAMDPNLQQDQHGMNPQVQQDQFMIPQVQQEQYMNPQVQQDQYMNPQVQQDQYGMNPQVQQEQFMNPQVQQEQFMNPQMQQEQYMNPQLQQDQYGMNPQVQQDQFVNSLTQQVVPTDPRMQQDQFMNSHRHQEVPTGPRLQPDEFVNARRQQSRTGISQMQQGLPYTMGANFVDTSGSGNFMQDMEGGNPQFHAQGHPSRRNVRYNNRQPSEPGYRN